MSSLIPFIELTGHHCIIGGGAWGSFRETDPAPIGMVIRVELFIPSPE